MTDDLIQQTFSLVLYLDSQTAQCAAETAPCGNDGVICGIAKHAGIIQVRIPAETIGVQQLLYLLL